MQYGRGPLGTCSDDLRIEAGEHVPWRVRFSVCESAFDILVTGALQGEVTGGNSGAL